MFDGAHCGYGPSQRPGRLFQAATRAPSPNRAPQIRERRVVPLPIRAGGPRPGSGAGWPGTSPCLSRPGDQRLAVRGCLPGVAHGAVLPRRPRATGTGPGSPGKGHMRRLPGPSRVPGLCDGRQHAVRRLRRLGRGRAPGASPAVARRVRCRRQAPGGVGLSDRERGRAHRTSHFAARPGRLTVTPSVHRSGSEGLGGR